MKVCLNMIVKNETRIIERLLTSVCPYIDEYVICDTGSTDATKEMITAFFAKRAIPGKIVEEPFRDFGYNRSVALKACDDMTAEYVLLLDADMVFSATVSPAQFRQSLINSGADAFHILQGSDTFYYKNMRIVKNHADFSYWGVTHEFVKTPPNIKIHSFDKGDVFINDIGDGGSKQDKFLRDIKLLTKGLEDLPNNDRYTFYLANSLKDTQQFDKAIEMYKNRVQIGGWIEEVWYSCYMIGKCYEHLGNMPSAIHWWMEAYNKYPNRIETLYHIVKHHRIAGNQNLAYTFYALADYERKKHTNWTDYLFLERGVYDFKLDYELSVLGYYCNRDNHDLAQICMGVLAQYGGDDGMYGNVLSNYKFYSKDLAANAIPMTDINRNVLLSVGRELLHGSLAQTVESEQTFVASTPSICFTNTFQLVVCQRFVNYKIDDNGGYVNYDHIETKNVIAIINIFESEWKIVKQFIMDYDKSHDARYVGIEDVRILSTVNSKNENVIVYNGNRGIRTQSLTQSLTQSDIRTQDDLKDSMVIEHGAINLATGATENAGFIQYSNSVNIEKNWVLFNTSNDNVNSLKCVYKWQPLTIGTITTSTSTEHQLSDVWEQPVPHVFKYIRGSTNGVVIGDEIWFLTHAVSYEARRYYYHMAVVLDRSTMRLKRYSRLFTFEKKPVEYTLGFVYIESSRQFCIGYSLMDKETKYIMVGRHVLESSLINV